MRLIKKRAKGSSLKIYYCTSSAHLSTKKGKNGCTCIKEQLFRNFEQLRATFKEFCNDLLEILEQLVAKAIYGCVSQSDTSVG